MEKLIIKNGSIYNTNGEKQKLEHGNLAQIQCLKNYSNKILKFMDDGFEVDPYFEKPTEIKASISFECHCGNNLKVNRIAIHDEDIDCFDDASISCETCYTEYSISINNNNSIVVKITNE